MNRAVLSIVLAGLLAVTCVSLLSGCNEAQAEPPAAAVIEPPAASPVAAAPAPVVDPPPGTHGPQLVAPNGKALTRYQGYYVGTAYADENSFDADKNPMYSNLINVSVDNIDGTYVSGHSVTAGNLRPFSGTLTDAQNGLYDMELKEPGGDKYDGAFQLQLDTNSNVMHGSWSSYDKQLAVTMRSLSLDKRTFAYDPNLKLDMYDESAMVYNGKSRRGKVEAVSADAGKYNASTKRLKSRHVENMYQRDLEMMRNAIYARHGYSFKNRTVRDFFDNYVPWYIPVSVDVTSELTPLEQQNIELIKRYEKHAGKYYDSFGR